MENYKDLRFSSEAARLALRTLEMTELELYQEHNLPIKAEEMEKVRSFVASFDYTAIEECVGTSVRNMLAGRRTGRRR
jgi:hypothetical protein